MRPPTRRRGTSSRQVVLLCAALPLLAACNSNAVGPETPLTYRITMGACGDVVFAERIGTDSASATAVIEARKVERYGEGRVMLEPYRLEVVDEHGESPRPYFYALRVLAVDTGILLHSVSEVVTTDGDLFHLRWCPD